MLFVLAGVAMAIMKYLEFGPVADLSWLWVLSPFAMAMAWWAWADATGHTQKQVMERELARKNARIARNRENIGIQGKAKKR